MKTVQKILCVNFILTNTIETAIACFALNLLIKTLGADQLGLYFSYSAMISTALIILSIYVSKKVSSIMRYLVTHIILVGMALVCIFTSSTALQAQLAFIAMMGFGWITYFSKWSVANVFVTPFESKRVFPLINGLAQLGVFLGSIYAMSSLIGDNKSHFFFSWLTVEVILVLFGFYFLALSKNKKEKPKVKKPEEQKSPSLFQVIRQYKFIPSISVWSFLWTLLFTCITTLTGKNFDESGVDLTVLYGLLSLATGLLASIASSLLYPKMVKKTKLGSVLLLSSVFAMMIGGLYLANNIFVVAILAYVTFKLIDGSFAVLAISTELGIYPSGERDRIRLFSEVLSSTVGTASVGLVFLLPETVVPVAVFVLLVLLTLYGFISKKDFNLELSKFLKGKDDEERENAIALFDNIKDQESYHTMLDFLENGSTSLTKVNVIDTFLSLGTLKPVAKLVGLLDKTNDEAVKIALLRYFNSVQLKQIDPFLRHDLYSKLKEISESNSSNVLRSMAVKIWVQNAPEEQAVGFILDKLKNEDDRIVANAIEGLNNMTYPGVQVLLKPFLESEVPRVKANSIIVLWNCEESKSLAQKKLAEMLSSSDVGEVSSGAWVCGEVKDSSQKQRLIELVDRPEKELQRNVPIALLKMGDETYYEKIIDLLIGEDERQAINVCYLSLRLDQRILNEKILQDIFDKKQDKVDLLIERYSKCGGNCKVQLELLSGRTANLMA